MKEIKSAVLMLIVFTVICGGIYPAVVTAVAQAVFPNQANGSFIADAAGKTVGSALIGQPFSAPQYFWPRPSASAAFSYNPAGSGGANAGPSNPAYLSTVSSRVKSLRESGISGHIPVELVQASASGLDPHISPAAAKVQFARIARARGMNEAALTGLVAAHTEARQLGFLGAPRVNVLTLNLELDRLAR